MIQNLVSYFRGNNNRRGMRGFCTVQYPFPEFRVQWGKVRVQEQLCTECWKNQVLAL